MLWKTLKTKEEIETVWGSGVTITEDGVVIADVEGKPVARIVGEIQVPETRTEYRSQAYFQGNPCDSKIGTEAEIQAWEDELKESLTFKHMKRTVLVD